MRPVRLISAGCLLLCASARARGVSKAFSVLDRMRRAALMCLALPMGALRVHAVAVMPEPMAGNRARLRSRHSITRATHPAGSRVHTKTGQGIFTLTGTYLGPR